MNASHLSLAVGLLVIVLVGANLAAGIVSEETQTYIDDSADWCEDRDGELVNVQSYAHGGLHCELPNGTSVHMSEVIARGG